MEKKKNSAGTIALVVLLLVVTIASLVLATYAWAKYTSKTSSAASATVAKWNVTFDKDNSKMFAKFNHVTETTIAPGTSGSFDIEVIPGNTEVCFDYNIDITSLTFVGADGKTPLDDNTTILEASEAATAGIDGVTSDIKLSDLKSHIIISNGTVSGPIGTDLAMDGEYHITGCADKQASQVLKRTVSWNWEYEGTGTEEAKKAYDVIDTAAGRYAAEHDLKLKFEYTITATQKTPVKAPAQQSTNP